MSTLLSMLGLSATDYAIWRDLDRELVYTHVNQYVGMADLAAMNAMSFFVEGTTEVYQEKYQLPMTGMMQAKRDTNTVRPRRRTGGYTVGYPLHEFGEELAYTAKAFAYMNNQDFAAHIDGILTLANNRRRHEILRRILNNTDFTFSDERHGDVTVLGLANGDSVTYPPIEGSDSEATDNHYLESGYAATAISDTNNPYETLYEELVQHTGDVSGDMPVGYLINPAEAPETKALTNFRSVAANGINYGQDTDLALNPPINMPGAVIGYIEGAGWVSVWRWCPANYIVARNLSTTAPLKMRVHPSSTGLPRGLVLAGDVTDYPNTFNDWELDFGVGTGNRLSAAVMELGTGGTYSVPSGYS